MNFLPIEQRYDVEFPHSLYRDLDFLKSELNHINAGTIADFGCATGRTALEFAKLGHYVECFDNNQGMLDIASETAEKTGLKVNIKTTNIDLNENYELVENSYDACVILGSSIGIIHSNKQQEYFFKEVYNSLKRKGLFILSQKNFSLFGLGYLKESPPKTFMVDNLTYERTFIIHPGIDFYTISFNYYLDNELVHIDKFKMKNFDFETTKKMLKKQFGAKNIRIQFGFEETTQPSEHWVFICER